MTLSSHLSWHLKMTPSPLKRHQYVWRWIWETHLDWNEISFDPDARTNTGWPVSPTISYTAYLATNTRVSCVQVCSREWMNEGEGRWNRAVTPDPPPKTKYHRITAAIKACHSSITQMYQDIKWLTDVKGVKKLVEMTRDSSWEGKYIESENSAWAKTCRGVVTWVLTMWQDIVTFLHVNKVRKRQKQRGRHSCGWSQLKSRWQVDLCVRGKRGRWCVCVNVCVFLCVCFNPQGVRYEDVLCWNVTHVYAFIRMCNFEGFCLWEDPSYFIIFH